MNHNIVGTILNKHNDSQLKELTRDVIKVLASNHTTLHIKGSVEAFNNIIKFMKSTPFDKELFTHLFVALIYGDEDHPTYYNTCTFKISVSKKDVGALVYYRDNCDYQEMCKYNSVIFKLYDRDRNALFNDIDDIVEGFERYGITEFKEQVFKNNYVVNLLGTLPDDYDNESVLKLFCSNFPSLALKFSKREFKRYLGHGPDSYQFNADIFEKNIRKVKDICKRYGKEVFFN